VVDFDVSPQATLGIISLAECLLNGSACPFPLKHKFVREKDAWADP
jgi:hypothetical protein